MSKPALTIIRFAALCFMFGLQGCFYTEYPPVITLSGQAIFKDTSKPISSSWVSVDNQRSFMAFVPVDYYTMRGVFTDNNGNFLIQDRLKNDTPIEISNNNVSYACRLPKFSKNVMKFVWLVSDSNRVENCSRYECTCTISELP